MNDDPRVDRLMRRLAGPLDPAATRGAEDRVWRRLREGHPLRLLATVAPLDDELFSKRLNGQEIDTGVETVLGGGLHLGPGDLAPDEERLLAALERDAAALRADRAGRGALRARPPD